MSQAANSRQINDVSTYMQDVGRRARTASRALAAADTGAMPAAADNIVEATFTVYGNCGMCKRTIEGALADVSAVSSANWDMKNKQLTVRYDAQAIQLKDIKAKVAAAGYDSDTHRAPDAAYNNLHACCQYERPKS